MKGREMGRTKLLALAAALSAATGLAALPAAAQASGDRVGEVVWAEGRVTGEPAGGAIGVLAVSDPVQVDMRVRTGPESRVRFTFEPRGVLALSSNTDVRLNRARLDAAGVYDNAFEVAAGYVYAAFSNLVHGHAEADTPAATVGVKGTVFGVRVVEDGETTVWAFEALGDDLTVTSKDTGDSVVLETGYVTVVARGAAPTPPIPFDRKTGVAEGITLPPPPLPPDVFEEPPLPPSDNDLPPDRGNDDSAPGFFGNDGKPGDG